MLPLIILIVGGFIIAILSTLSGGGASLLLMPLIGFAVGTKSIAPIMTIGISMSSSSRVYYFWEHIDWKLFRWLFPSTILGSILGSLLYAYLSSEYLQIIIGIFLISTVYQLKGKKTNQTNKDPDSELDHNSNDVSLDKSDSLDELEKPKTSWKAWYFAPIGFIISFLSGLIGGVGPLMNSAYLKYGIPKEGLIGTRSANAVVLHVTKIISYGSMGFIDWEIAKYGILLGVASVIGNYWGKKYLMLLSEAKFRYIVVLSMIISGVIILWKNRVLGEEIMEFLIQI
ncbi:MAG: sulfite exporter TauE/SafE family protein [Leptospira sp.]|nr:sulfite exporter TauE/SafE family protein [Leptospira sp.]